MRKKNSAQKLHNYPQCYMGDFEAVRCCPLGDGPVYDIIYDIIFSETAVRPVQSRVSIRLWVLGQKFTSGSHAIKQGI